MGNLVKSQGVHFKRYKSGRIRWYFGKDEYCYYKNLLLGYIADNYEAYFSDPLLYTTIQEMFFKYFNTLLDLESVKIDLSEAVALLLLLEKFNEKDFLYHELKSLLRL